MRADIDIRVSAFTVSPEIAPHKTLAYPVSQPSQGGFEALPFDELLRGHVQQLDCWVGLSQLHEHRLKGGGCCIVFSFM